VFDRGVEFKDPQTFNEFTLTYRTGDIVSPQVSAAEPLGIEMDHFLECARSGETPRTDGQSGLRVVRVLEAIERSGRNGNRLERIDWGRAGTSVAPGVLDGAGVQLETENGDGRHRRPAGLPALVNGAMAASRGTDS